MKRFLPCLLLVVMGCSRAYHSAEGGFSVAFPGEPKERKEPGKATSLTVEKEGVTFIVSWAGIAANNEQDNVRLLERELADMSTREKGFKARKAAEITLVGGHIGREMWFDSDGGWIIRVQACIANGKLYKVLVLGKGLAATSQEAEKFLDSFKVEQG
jgi:hypothetical protein